MKTLVLLTFLVAGCGGQMSLPTRHLVMCMPDEVLCGLVCIPLDGQCCDGVGGAWCEAGRYCDRGHTCTLEGEFQCGAPDSPPSGKACKLSQSCTPAGVCVSP